MDVGGGASGRVSDNVEFCFGVLEVSYGSTKIFGAFCV